MIRELRLAALIHKSAWNDPLVIPAEQAVEMATLGGAVAMGIDDKVGSLEPGKLADIILVDMTDVGLTPNINPVSNLVYAGSGHYVDTVMVNGKLLMKDKKLLTMDVEKIKEQAIEHSRALHERADVKIEPKWPII
jgi:cytosine/adenosine deaminase-related metal-dependent hydrolase